MARPSSRPSPRQRGYDTRWDRARAGFLASHPWCRSCAAEGKRVQAVVVDHIRPHRGDQALFWDRTNWQPLCTPCHSSTKQQVETRGYASRVGRDGVPTDVNHPFNREGGGGVKSPGRKGSGPHGYRSVELIFVMGAALLISALHAWAML